MFFSSTCLFAFSIRIPHLFFDLPAALTAAKTAFSLKLVICKSWFKPWIPRPNRGWYQYLERTCHILNWVWIHCPSGTTSGRCIWGDLICFKVAIWQTTIVDMGVYKNSGTPQIIHFNRVSLINHPFWGTTIFGNTHMVKICLKLTGHQTARDNSLDTTALSGHWWLHCPSNSRWWRTNVKIRFWKEIVTSQKLTWILPPHPR